MPERRSPESLAKKRAYNRRYQTDTIETMSVQSPKELAYKARIKILADDEGISVNRWILRAIENELRAETEGISPP